MESRWTSVPRCSSRREQVRGSRWATCLPAVVHAADAEPGRSRVVVATATLALQHQLVERDLPRMLGALSDELRRDVTYSTLKGRSNYLCLARVSGPIRPADFERSTLEEQAARINEWSQSTQTGDRDELEDISGIVWSAFSVTAQECSRGSGCAFVERLLGWNDARSRTLAPRTSSSPITHCLR